MDPNALADTKAQVKRAIAQQLATLPLQAQADVLADLRLALGAGELQGPRAHTHAMNGARGHAKAPKRRVSSRQSVGDSKTDQICATLKAHPRMSIPDLAEAVYPGEEHAVRRLRQALFSLNKQGRLKHVGTGQWEVAA